MDSACCQDMVSLFFITSNKVGLFCAFLPVITVFYEPGCWITTELNIRGWQLGHSFRDSQSNLKGIIWFLFESLSVQDKTSKTERQLPIKCKSWVNSVVYLLSALFYYKNTTVRLGDSVHVGNHLNKKPPQKTTRQPVLILDSFKILTKAVHEDWHIKICAE